MEVTLHLHTPQPHMMIKIGSALFLFLLLLLGTTAQPASLGDLLQPEAGLFEFTQPTHAEDVLTAFVFPDSPEKRMPAGEPVEVLVGFRNNGTQQYNITSIDASFNYPLDFSFYIQNFSRWEFGTPVPPLREVTLSYMFKPDALLEPREFGLLVNVHYKDLQGKNYTTVVFNSTVILDEPLGGWDAQSAFAILAVLALFGLGGFFLYRYLRTWVKKQKQKTVKKTDYGTKARKSEVEDDWLAGTPADPMLHNRKQNQKKKPNVTRSS